LLLHGYNVSEREAEREFSDFEDALTSIAPPLSSELGRVLWPGDWGVPFVRGLSYPWRVRTAIACAPQLADYISRRVTPGGTPTAVVIVAHSLGCRLVLEALHRLGQG